VRKLLYCKIFIWLRRSTLQLGAQGGERRRERERYLQAKCVDRTVFFHLIYQETQLCGRSSRERVNHIYLVVMCDGCCVIFPLLYFLCIVLIDLRYKL
jgi:hypothetical protein